MNCNIILTVVAWYVFFEVVIRTRLWPRVRLLFVCQRNIAAVFTLWIKSFIYYVLNLRVGKYRRLLLCSYKVLWNMLLQYHVYSDIPIKVMATRGCRVRRRNFAPRLWSFNNLYVINKYVFGEDNPGRKFTQNFISFRGCIVLVLAWKRAPSPLAATGYLEFEQRSLG